MIGTTDQQASEVNIFPGPVDIQQIVAHEAGHGMCLHHVCAKPDEDPEGALFGRECAEGDEDNLMYPYWTESDSMVLQASEIDLAKRSATHTEDGKISVWHPGQSDRCAAEDTTN